MSNVYSQYDFRVQKIKIRISYIYNIYTITEKFKVLERGNIIVNVLFHQE